VPTRHAGTKSLRQSSALDLATQSTRVSIVLWTPINPCWSCCPKTGRMESKSYVVLGGGIEGWSDIKAIHRIISARAWASRGWDR
jgi:hypothetical protein